MTSGRFEPIYRAMLAISSFIYWHRDNLQGATLMLIILCVSILLDIERKVSK
jgi:hypothetical protein